jgi:DNA-binding MarR family transcriptional regulator
MAISEGPHAESTLDELYRRPGFLIRRAQQIAVSLFLEESGALGITNSQYGILMVLRHQPGTNQISLSKLLGLDRSTTGMVVDKLESTGLVKRRVASGDRRKRELVLTRAGERMLAELAEPARRAQVRVLEPFTPEEQAAFLGLLEKFVGRFNGSTRVPLEKQRAAQKAKKRRAA